MIIWSVKNTPLCRILTSYNKSLMNLVLKMANFSSKYRIQIKLAKKLRKLEMRLSVSRKIKKSA